MLNLILPLLIAHACMYIAYSQLLGHTPASKLKKIIAFEAFSLLYIGFSLGWAFSHFPEAINPIFIIIIPLISIVCTRNAIRDVCSKEREYVGKAVYKTGYFGHYGSHTIVVPSDMKNAPKIHISSEDYVRLRVESEAHEGADLESKKIHVWYLPYKNFATKIELEK